MDSETLKEKPWEGAPNTDTLWKRHTEDAASLEDSSRDLKHYYEMACRACTLERSLARRDALLREAVTTIHGLVDQQAMPDNFWESIVERIEQELKG